MPVRTLGEVVGREWWWGWGWCWGWGWNDLQCLGAKWNWDLCGGKPLTTFWRFLSSETKTKIVLSRLRVQIGKGCSKWSAEGKEDGWLGGEDKASSRINVLICYAPTCRLSLVLSPQFPPWFCVIFTRSVPEFLKKGRRFLFRLCWKEISNPLTVAPSRLSDSKEDT